MRSEPLEARPTKGNLIHLSHDGDIIAIEEELVAQLIVRNLEADLVQKLKLRAARRGRSAEAEHRQILREALKGRSAAKTLKQRLLEMPPVGDDRDFARPRDVGRRTRL
jgi:plasmid stability protein